MTSKIKTIAFDRLNNSRFAFNSGRELVLVGDSDDLGYRTILLLGSRVGLEAAAYESFSGASAFYTRGVVSQKELADYFFDVYLHMADFEKSRDYKRITRNQFNLEGFMDVIMEVTADVSLAIRLSRNDLSFARSPPFDIPVELGLFF